MLAQAKSKQWTQRRILIEQTRTFADASTETASILVTGDTAYLQRRGVWRSRAVPYRERPIRLPEATLKGMGLGTCITVGGVREAKQAATIYSYDYLPDDQGYIAHVRLWVSDSTGLPLREEMLDPAPPANAMVATSISATYQYNDEFDIPAGAEKTESTRLFDVRQSVLHQQAGIAGGRATRP